ncbi:phage major capsid protein [Arcobacter roscoffensis]|uniref:Phage major capsid protein n=1 Tax=Arcobacter roscoffensis TaxID=2961520 RepID=A0ABY5E3T2_9BACT|nr:phage major capsid protein [Arcobacter roscoffensis]UTJ05396.1 phage major capsid protein [Arcobacter roscoffensis]
MTLEQLRALQAKRFKQLQAILDGADSEKGLTHEESQRYDSIEEEYERDEKQIKRLERASKRNSYMNQETTNPAYENGTSNDNNDDEDSSDIGKRAFWKMARNEALTPEESRALVTTNDSKGGYLVPETFADTIIQKTTEKSYIRDLATVTLSSHTENIPVEGDDGENGWIDEEGTYPESDPTIGNVQLSAWKTGRIVKVTDEALEDSVPAIEGYVAMKFSKSTTKAEEAAFISGDGTKKPKGVLVTAETGLTTATIGISGDEMIDFMASLDEDYEGNAWLMMNKNTRAKLRKLKGSDGQYLWVQGFNGNPDTFDNKPIRINKYMPDIAANTTPIAYGDFSYYHIKDRKVMTLKRLNEKYADTGHVGFRIDKRVDGKLVLPEAVKKLKMPAS